ncbi:unnamed protein product [Penicillium olsonii]|nr:unnamed protein product [Penicillium olsonii]
MMPDDPGRNRLFPDCRVFPCLCRHQPHYSLTLPFTMSKTTINPRSIQSRLTHILNHWPSDAVRPASVSVQTYIQSRLQSASKSSPEISETSTKALEALLGNRFAAKYPLPQKLRRPASNPEHYDNVVREFAEAPNRDWFGRLKKRMAGIIRLT